MKLFGFAGQLGFGHRFGFGGHLDLGDLGTFLNVVTILVSYAEGLEAPLPATLSIGSLFWLGPASLKWLTDSFWLAGLNTQIVSRQLEGIGPCNT